MQRTVQVTLEIDVTVDESKFTPEFMQEFREYLYPFDTIEDHIEHIAQLEARGLWRDDFNEGYAEPEKYGITVKPIYCDTEILKETSDG